MITEDGYDLINVVDVRGLSQDLKKVVWSKLWDKRQGPVGMLHSNNPSFIYVYKKSNFPGNVAWVAREMDELSLQMQAIVVRPKFRQEFVYEGMEESKEIVVDGKRYVLAED